MAKRVFTVAAGVALLALGGYALLGGGVSATTGGYSEAIPIQEVAPQPETAQPDTTQPETQGRDCPARDGGSARGGYGDASGEGQYVGYRYGRDSW